MWLIRMVPEGVTVQDCVVGALPGALADTVKLFEVRACAAVGVHETVLPLRVAPVGALAMANVTALPLAAS